MKHAWSLDTVVSRDHPSIYFFLSNTIPGLSRSILYKSICNTRIVSTIPLTITTDNSPDIFVDIMKIRIIID